jgi:hypothetical protein
MTLVVVGWRSVAKLELVKQGLTAGKQHGKVLLSFSSEEVRHDNDQCRRP